MRKNIEHLKKVNVSQKAKTLIICVKEMYHVCVWSEPVVFVTEE